MSGREFTGYVARGIRRTKDYTGIEEGMRKFVLDIDEASALSAQMVGLPVCGEHKTGVAIGCVKASRLNADTGDWEADFVIENSEAGEEAQGYIDLGYQRSLSLQHAVYHETNRLEAVELTVCQVPARDGAVITKGMADLKNSKIPIYNEKWERIIASAREGLGVSVLKASAGSSVPGRVIIRATRPTAAAVTPAEPIAMNNSEHKSTAAPGAAAPTEPPVAMATGDDSMTRAPPPTNLSSPAAPPAAGGGIPAPVATPEDIANAPLNRFRESMLDVLVPPNPTQEAKIKFMNEFSTQQKQREDEVTELRTRAERAERAVAEAETKMKDFEAKASEKARFAASQQQAWRENERAGLTPPGTTDGIMRDIGNGALAAAGAATTAVPASASAVPDPESERDRGWWDTMLNKTIFGGRPYVPPTDMRSLASPGHQSTPRAPSMGTATRGGGGGIVAAAAPRGRDPHDGIDTSCHTPIDGSGHMRVDRGIMEAVMASAVAGGSTSPVRWYLFNEGKGTGHEPEYWLGPSTHICASALLRHVPFKPFDGEGVLMACGIPRGRASTVVAPSHLASIMTSVRASGTFRSDRPGGYLTGDREPLTDFKADAYNTFVPRGSGARMMMDKLPLPTQDPASYDRVAASGWGNGLKWGTKGVIPTAVGMPEVEVPHYSHFPTALRLHENHVLYQLLCDKSDDGYTRDNVDTSRMPSQFLDDPSRRAEKRHYAGSI